MKLCMRSLSANQTKRLHKPMALSPLVLQKGRGLGEEAIHPAYERALRLPNRVNCGIVNGFFSSQQNYDLRNH
jgi:hypothetical protein